MRLGDAIVRQRGVLIGGTEIDWTNPTLATYAAEVFSPSSDEDVLYAQRVNAQYVTQAEAAADIDPADRIVWQGDTYEVASGVDKLSAHGRVRHLRFLIRRVTGG